MSQHLNESTLRAGLEEMIESGVTEGLAENLTDFVRESSDLSLFRVDPLRFAAEHGLSEDEGIDLFLYATAAGLFQMEWNIVCASCGNVFRSFRKLEKVDPHFHCTLCDMENPSRLDDIIQVVFTVNPDVRRIVFHNPEELSLDQLLFEYHYSPSARTHAAGMLTVDFLRENTIVLQRLKPEETVECEVELVEGSLLIRDWTTSFSFFVGRDEEPATRSFRLAISDDGLEHHGIPASAVPIPTAVGTLALPAVHALGPGTIRLSVLNQAPEPRPVWIVRYPSFFVAATLATVENSGSLSARRLLNSSTFRDLYRWEAPGSEEGLSVTDLSYLFTDLSGSTSMYDEVGDVTAYNLVRAHFGVIEDAVTSNQGVVIKTIGDAVMATFLTPTGAVSAALSMVKAMRSIAVAGDNGLRLKVGVHRGHSIAVTLNGRLDYFGQNVNIAARTQQIAGPDEILITDEVMDYEGVPELLQVFDVTTVDAVMPGVNEDITVFRVAVS